MMRLTEFDSTLRQAFGDRVVRDAPLAPLTTFKVGGPADWLLTLEGADEIRQALLLARGAGIPVRMLGGGSNVLVSDRGVRGIVIRLRGGGVTRLDSGATVFPAGSPVGALEPWA